MDEREAKWFGHRLPELLDAAHMAKPLSGNRDLYLALQEIHSRWSPEIRYSGGAGNSRESDRFLKDSWALLSWLKTESKS